MNEKEIYFLNLIFIKTSLHLNQLRGISYLILCKILFYSSFFLQNLTTFGYKHSDECDVSWKNWKHCTRQYFIIAC